MSNGRTPKATRPDPLADARTERGERAARPRSTRSGRLRLDPGRTEWQLVTYEEHGSYVTVRLNGRMTTVHPLWREQFQSLKPEDLEKVAPALSRLKDWLSELLVERPGGIVIQGVGDREVTRVVHEVDLFDLAAFLRLRRIPVRELPGTVDVERLILLHGFVESFVRSLVTRPDRVVASIAKAEKVGKLLIGPRKRGSGIPVFRSTKTDLSRLLGRDLKTLQKIKRALERQGDADGSWRSAPGQGDRTSVASAHKRTPVAAPAGRKGSSRSIERGESKPVGTARRPREAATQGMLHKRDLRGVTSRVRDSRDGVGMDRGNRVGRPQTRKKAKHRVASAALAVCAGTHSAPPVAASRWSGITRVVEGRLST